MNEAWQEATATHHKAPEDLTHNQEVARLYRHSLKLMTSWVIDRATVCEAATAIRAEFDRHTGKDVATGSNLLEEGKGMLFAQTHPDRYILPYMPGGSKFMRNPPPPLSAVYPDGIPEDVANSITELHVDQIPVSIRPPPENILCYLYEKKHR